MTFLYACVDGCAVNYKMLAIVNFSFMRSMHEESQPCIFIFLSNFKESFNMVTVGPFCAH